MWDAKNSIQKSLNKFAANSNNITAILPELIKEYQQDLLNQAKHNYVEVKALALASLGLFSFWYDLAKNILLKDADSKIQQSLGYLLVDFWGRTLACKSQLEQFEANSAAANLEALVFSLRETIALLQSLELESGLIFIDKNALNFLIESFSKAQKQLNGALLSSLTN